jgi:hypothetical protein
MNKEEFEKAFQSGKIDVSKQEIEQIQQKIPETKYNPMDMLNSNSTRKHNPLLQKLQRIPGETFRLPSKGIFYKNGEIDESVVNGEVTVYSMTGYEELIMRSPDMLFQGTALEKVISRCVPMVLKPLELTANDVEYLLTCIRKVTYGDNLKILYACDNKECELPMEERVHKEYEIPLNDFLMNTKEITRDSAEKLKFVLADIFEVEMIPARMGDILEIRRALLPKYDDIIEAGYATHLKLMSSVIKSVDGIEDKDIIVEWLDNLNVEMKDELLEKLKYFSEWGITFECKFKCKDCGKEVVKNESLNPIDFFLTPYGVKIT